MSAEVPAGSALAGSRIRARRLDAGVAQGELARRIGVSPSYLNLIEHNRRRIGGKLLNAIARALDLEPALLAEGAGGALVARLAAAAAAQHRPGAAPEEFAGRFPDWAALVDAQARRIETLEGQVSALGDRLAHDPELSASLHQVITAATAIRSTASILAGGETLDRDWQARFHRNIHAESLRLAESSRRLAGYLEAPGGDPGGAALSPQEQVERFFEAMGHHLPALEGARPAMHPSEIAAGAPGLDAAAQTLMKHRLESYRADAAALPLDEVAKAWQDSAEPLAMAARLGQPLERVLRRLAALPAGIGPPRAGLVVCDAAGAILQRRPLDGLTLPRGGAACPLWPLFEALTQPGRPLRAVARLPGESADSVLCCAIATIIPGADWDAAPRIEAVMLMMPQGAEPSGLPERAVGPGCRLCPRRGCLARREPSLLPRLGEEALTAPETPAIVTR
ncbi:short-chain fatty acyl-CoA regulator family protein [uncultured Limimaricola sp.]|uniref:short-chain fatty acyl-CoA regulator family protein n=1 Tax=uncultured Limimaricola sp. TaxID=2211667 RepID=UPI0030F5D198